MAGAGAERTAVFAYGSLVSATSAALTLGRDPQTTWPDGHAVPATLRGWVRRFSQARDNRASEKTFACDEDGEVPAFVLGLDVSRTADPADTVNGLLVPVSDSELERLDRRELRYDRVDVGREIEAAGRASGLQDVITYRARPENFAPTPPPGSVVLRSYVDAVEAAFAALGGGELECFRRTTGPIPVEVVDAHLVRDRIPHGNPRAW